MKKTIVTPKSAHSLEIEKLPKCIKHKIILDMYNIDNLKLNSYERPQMILNA
jgi:hypothetical protein